MSQRRLNLPLRPLLDPCLYQDRVDQKISNPYQVPSCPLTLNQTDHHHQFNWKPQRSLLKLLTLGMVRQKPFLFFCSTPFIPFPATWIEHHFTDDIQTRQYRCPEVILGAKWGTSSDLWSVACIVCFFFFHIYIISFFLISRLVFYYYSSLNLSREAIISSIQHLVLDTVKMTIISLKSSNFSEKFQSP